jgi:hypothetical protein
MWLAKVVTPRFERIVDVVGSPRVGGELQRHEVTGRCYRAPTQTSPVPSRDVCLATPMQPETGVQRQWLFGSVSDSLVERRSRRIVCEAFSATVARGLTGIKFSS